ncbi:methyl-accepting chemotaxis protein [Burkholderia plantarii]|uniref:Methyl-accepting chemotaxis citrate transducer n=1 Tax=Burkholderia plantarii TaxID=41899 RepID=A0A0B6S2Z5_BURPL|nr:methyl-accepting chemotaxis protein [Burkholderia plantarii]AJK48759.1 methyl-accepting chemotaxis citrate transducer [Burkholderia plantarii]
MNLNRLNIGARLGIGFGIVLLLMCAMAAMGAYQISRVFSGTNELAVNWLPSVETLGEIRANANAARRFTLRLIISTDPAVRSGELTRREAAIAAMNRNLPIYGKMVSSPHEQDLYNAIQQRWTDYLTLDQQVIAASGNGAGSQDEARALANGKASSTFASLLDVIEQDIQLNHQGAMDDVATARSHYHEALLLAGALGLVSLLMGAAVAIAISRSITVPLRRSMDIAEKVAGGELDVSIEVHGNDEAARLQLAMKRMTESLGTVVARVMASADGVTLGSSEIAAGNIDLSQRTEEQAASLEETAASMDQITATVKQNTDNARQGNVLARNASDVACKGGEVVARVVDTMQGITTSSRQVAEIITVIEGIAFQTNILALNAAVEAARAGEQGRGFAVVAGEVRTLAQRSAAAAKEIKQLIGASVERVAQGSELVTQAGDTMQEVVQAVSKVTDLMGEITIASEEQQKGIEQINQAVAQMDQVTQQNAALVEEAAAAAQSLESQGRELREAVSFFKSGRTAQRGGGGLALASTVSSSNTSVAKDASRPSTRMAPVRTTRPRAVSRPALAAATPDGDSWAAF